MSYKNKKTETKPPQNYRGNRFSGYIASNEAKFCELLFEGRKFYRDNTFQTKFLKEKRPFNNWQISMGFQYGKVNLYEEPIYINEYYLKQFKAADTIFALAPVVDAYHDLYDYIRGQKLRAGNSIIASESIFRKMKVTKGWESLNSHYSKYLQNLAKEFTSTYLSPAKEKKIFDFESFLKIFIEFITSGITGDIPITLTAYMRSIYCNPRVSGLVIDVFDADHADDPLKKGFLTDFNFNFWIDTVEKFGFFVNKNAPWSLTANIVGSRPFSRYMSKHGIPFGDLEKSFGTFYKSVYDIEIPIMAHYLAELYNNYVISRPTIAIASLKEYAKGHNKSSIDRVTSVHTIKREPLKCFTKRKLDQDSDYVKKYGELFWIRYYYYLRMLEEKKHINTVRLNRDFKQRMHPYYRVHGLVSTIRAINQELVQAPPYVTKTTRELRGAGYSPRDN